MKTIKRENVSMFSVSYIILKKIRDNTNRKHCIANNVFVQNPVRNIIPSFKMILKNILLKANQNITDSDSLSCATELNRLCAS